MMYFEFMKNFLLAGSGWQMPVWLFRSPEPKNVLLLLSRHDVLRVHEKFFSRRFRRADACWTHFGLLSPKTFCSYFLDMMYVEFIKILFSAIPASRCLLESFRPPEPKNILFLISRHDVLRVHEKFSSPYSGVQMPVTLISAS